MKYEKLNAVKYASTERQKKQLESLGYVAVEQPPASTKKKSNNKAVKQEQTGGTQNEGTDTADPGGDNQNQQAS